MQSIARPSLKRSCWARERLPTQFFRRNRGPTRREPPISTIRPKQSSYSTKRDSRFRGISVRSVTVSAASAQPEGLPESSRWSESAETTGKVISHDRTPKGCQTSGQRKRSLPQRIWHPSGCDPFNIAFPVVSADSDHRLLSLQPFGLLRSVNYIVTLAKPRLGLKSDAATQLTLTTAGDEIRRRH